MDSDSKGEEPEAKKDEVMTQSSDTKLSSDSKSVQARIVRGTKKMRIDSTESTQLTEQKKGQYSRSSFCYFYSVVFYFICKKCTFYSQNKSHRIQGRGECRS